MSFSQLEWLRRKISDKISDIGTKIDEGFNYLARYVSNEANVTRAQVIDTQTFLYNHVGATNDVIINKTQHVPTCVGNQSGVLSSGSEISFDGAGYAFFNVPGDCIVNVAIDYSTGWMSFSQYSACWIPFRHRIAFTPSRISGGAISYNVIFYSGMGNTN